MLKHAARPRDYAYLIADEAYIAALPRYLRKGSAFSKVDKNSRVFAAASPSRNQKRRQSREKQGGDNGEAQLRRTSTGKARSKVEPSTTENASRK